MTANKRAKRAARERQHLTGERYTAARRMTAVPQHRRFEPDRCASCFKDLAERDGGLFCSELCSQTADLIRYCRRIRQDDRINDPEVKLAVATRMAHILAGGYHNAARDLSSAVRQQVWTRDGALCVQCSQPGMEIDHIDGDSDELSNLQLLCLDCHHAKTAEQMVPASPDQVAWIQDLYRKRVNPELPALLADDEIRWKDRWSTLKKERRARLLEQLDDLGYARSDFPGVSWADMWDEVLDDVYADEGGYTEDDDSGYGPYSYFAHAMGKDD